MTFLLPSSREFALALLGLCIAIPTAVHASKPTADITPSVRQSVVFPISHISGTHIYLKGGRVAGLRDGGVLEVRRSGETIASLEIVFLADHSASCRQISGTDLRLGDLAFIQLSGSAPGASLAGTGARPEVRSRSAEPLQTAGNPQAPVGPRTQIRGSFTLSYRQFDDQGIYERGFGEGGARLSLSLLEIGGSAWSFNTRLRRSEIQRDRNWSESNPEREALDRFYEMALAYEPESDKAQILIGRVGANPLVPIGYLDGVLGEYRVGQRHHLGGLAGRQPDIREIGFDQLAEKYGAFYRFTNPRGSRLMSEVLLAAIGEYDQGEISREYAAIEARLRSRTWYFSQRAEIDVNRDWREEVSGQTSQLTNLSLTGSMELKPGTRLTLGYNQFRPYLYRYLDAPPTPEQVLNDFLRQGFRAGIQTRSRGAWFGSASLGVRDSGDAKQPTYSAFGSLGHSGAHGLTITGDLSVYTGEISDGFLASARVSRPFRGGHDVGLSLGHSMSTVVLNTLYQLTSTAPVTGNESDRSNDWIRLDGRVELPGNLFASGQVEFLQGDDLEGTRVFADIGYRF